jgi:hypothetical protein
MLLLLHHLCKLLPDIFFLLPPPLSLLRLLPLQASLWKKKAAPARQKRTYKTAAEVLQEAAAGGAPAASAQPILDLRGPQARLVTDLEQLNTAAGERGTAVSCSSLLG